MTDNGLLAAAHKEGPGGVSRYFRHIRQNGGKMNPSVIGTTPGDSFEAIEKRLREFATIEHRARP